MLNPDALLVSPPSRGTRAKLLRTVNRSAYLEFTDVGGFDWCLLELHSPYYNLRWPRVI